MKSNPNAMRTLQKNSLFTNVAVTDDGNVFWEGLENYTDKATSMTNWRGQKWKMGDAGQAAQANSRFTSPVKSVLLCFSAFLFTFLFSLLVYLGDGNGMFLYCLISI